MERINQFLARRGVGSRRGVETLIDHGAVTVNGVLGVIGQHIDAARDVVKVNGVLVQPHEQPVVIMLNKPKGYVTSVKDPHHEQVVMQLLPTIPGLIPIGRLDEYTRGLLLCTNDGDLCYRLTHPKFSVPKRYKVTIDARARNDQIERLVRGIRLSDGVARADDVQRTPQVNALVITIHDGKNREIRRMCEEIGWRVRDLQRLSHGSIELGTLPEGKWRKLTGRQMQSLYESVRLPKQT